MRISLLATAAALALMTAGCGGGMKAPDDDGPGSTAANSSAATPTANVVESRSTDAGGSPLPTAADPLSTRSEGTDSPPDISPDSAPDVAFGYTYSFGLGPDRIASVQQRHARLCEELGTQRCEVKGMNFRRTNENDVRAELKLALEPGLAHRFGERALDSVREAEGTLVDSQVTGVDVGSDIRASGRTIAELEEQLAEIETRIAASGNASLRRTLQAEADAMRERIRSLRGTRTEAREKLATTPVTLSYASGAYVSGQPNFGGAVGSAWAQLKWLAYGLFVILLVLGPWALAAAAIWLGVRARRRRVAAEAVSAG